MRGGREAEGGGAASVDDAPAHRRSMSHYGYADMTHNSNLSQEKADRHGFDILPRLYSGAISQETIMLTFDTRTKLTQFSLGRITLKIFDMLIAQKNVSTDI